MAIITTNSQHYSAIAAALREKTGTEGTYRPAEMAAAVAAMETAPQRTTGIDFSAAAEGTFTETLEGGAVVTYTMTLTDGRPTAISDGEHTVTVGW